MSEEKKDFELKEEDLEKVSGGRQFPLTWGNHVTTCPFSDCGHVYTKCVGEYVEYANTNTPIGTCKCSASIYYSWDNTAKYVRDGESLTTTITCTE